MSWLRLHQYLDIPVLIWVVDEWKQKGDQEFVPPVDWAAQRGHLQVLQWIRAHGGEWTSRTANWAAQGGHLQILQWIRWGVDKFISRCSSGSGWGWTSKAADSTARGDTSLCSNGFEPMAVSGLITQQMCLQNMVIPKH